MRRSRTPHDPDLLKSAGCCHIEWCLHSTDNLVLLENVTVVAAFPLQELCLGFASQPGKASKHLSRGLRSQEKHSWGPRCTALSQHSSFQPSVCFFLVLKSRPEEPAFQISDCSSLVFQRPARTSVSSVGRPSPSRAPCGATSASTPGRSRTSAGRAREPSPTCPRCADTWRYVRPARLLCWC